MIPQMFWLGLALTIHGFGLSIVGIMLLFEGVNRDGDVVVMLIGLIYVAAWIIQTFAGSQARHFRSPRLISMAVALCFFGVLTVVGAPFSVLILIFGVMIMRDRSVRWAFAEIARGAKLVDVKRGCPFGDERDDYDDGPPVNGEAKTVEQPDDFDRPS